MVKGEISRIHAPLTFETLFDKTRDTGSFTVRSRGNIGLPKAYWMLLINIHRGKEKKEYKDYKKGDIVYCPRQDAIYLVYDNAKIPLPVFLLGKITEGVDNISKLRNGVMAKIELHEI